MAEIARMFPRLPSVDKVLSSTTGRGVQEEYSRDAFCDAIRAVLDAVRERARAGQDIDESGLTPDAVAMAAASALSANADTRMRHVVNATGVVLHTNLGRALLADSAIEAVARAAAEPLALEYDVVAGKRGDRDDLVSDHLRALTGAEAATVVNNNAAAVLLLLNSLAEGREVVVSRGELVEIGGSFRIPDVMAKSQAVLREVGTTNRTHAADYERAVTAETAMLLKVHTSNYRIVGFTKSVSLSELSEIASKSESLIVAEDLGAGALLDLARWDLPAEPVVADRLAEGADVVTFSGDKLLGGPQCGIIVGRQDLIDKIRRNPLKRALRCDKMTLAALEATLRIYRFGQSVEDEIPTLRMLVRSVEDLESMGATVVDKLGAILGEEYVVSVEPSEAQTGSGSQPEITIPSRAVVIVSDSHSPDRIATMFRGARRPIVGRIENDRFLLDLRTVAGAEDLIPDFS
jgi:L-seryl-tRNA(Ser) seleniumtransferase